MGAYLEYFKERVPWARDMEDRDIVSHMSKVTGRPIQDVAAEFGVKQEYGLIPDIKRGFGQAVSGIGSTMRDIGMPDAGQAVENYGAGIAFRNPSQINTFSDVLDKPFTTAREAIGEVVPQAGTAMAGGFGGRLVGGAIGGALGSVVPGIGTAGGAAAGQWLGGLAGSLLPIAGQTYGGIRAEQREQGIDDKGRAALVTIPAAALERLGVEQLAAKVGTKGLKSLATKELLPGESAWGYAGRQAMKTGLVEGPFTEVPQTALERYGAYQDLTSDEALNAYGVAGAKGYVGGAAVGGAMAPFSLLPESNPSPKTDTPPPPAPRGQMGLFTPEEIPPTPGAVAPTGTPFADAQTENAVRDLLVQRAQFATRMASAQAAQNTPEFYQAQDIIGRIDEQLAQLPQGLVESVAQGMQAAPTQLGLFGAQPFNQQPTVPTPNKTPFFEPPLVSTIPGGSTLPVLGPQPQIVTGENPNAQLVLPQADPVQAFQQAYEKQQRGELLTRGEIEILRNPPQGIQLPQAAPQGPTVRREPTQGELFDTPLRSAYDVATRGLPPVAPQGPVLNNQQAPGQAELFFPNGQPTYAATQNVPDVAGAVAETSRAASIPASRPGSKTGTKRQQLLERIEKARMEGRFVGREEQYDDLVNDLAQNAFGRVEKGITEVEKAPLQPAPQAGASPLAAPGARTLQEVDAEMDAMLVKGRAPQGGVAREAWNDLQRERDALAAQVGAPPRPKYVPPQKAAPKKEEPKKEPPKKEAPKKPEAKKEAPKKEEPKKEAPASLKETPQQAFDAMEDRIAYKDLTPEAKGLVDGAHKEGQLSQERIDSIVRQDQRNKLAAKRAANKPKPEDDLEEDEAPQPKKKAKLDKVPPAVLAKTEVEIDALNPDTGKFEKTKVPADQAVESLKEDKDTFQNFVNCLKKGK